MVTPRVRLGELLVEAHIITREQLEQTLAAQRSDGRRIGTLLIEDELVSETQVTQIVSQQLSVPWVSLYHIDFSRQLLNFVSHELAERYCLVPIFVRRVRGLGDTLYLAMDDPSDDVAQREVSAFAGLPVRAMIAPPSDIRSAIRAYYGAGQDSSSLSEAMAETHVERRGLKPASFRAPAVAEAAPLPGPPASSTAERSTATPVSAPAPSAVQSATPTMRTGERPAPPSASLSRAAMTAAAEVPVTIDADGDAPDSAPQIEVREIAMPARKRGRMLSLTLLDGTQVNLPARGAAAQPEKPVEEVPARDTATDGETSGVLTARDLVAALRAVSHGADATEILGENVRWEALFSALLSLMLKKHLIADWEFVDEYKKV